MLSLHPSKVAHQAITYPGFCSVKQLGVFLLLPGWYAITGLPPVLNIPVSSWLTLYLKYEPW